MSNRIKRPYKEWGKITNSGIMNWNEWTVLEVSDNDYYDLSRYKSNMDRIIVAALKEAKDVIIFEYNNEETRERFKDKLIYELFQNSRHRPWDFIPIRDVLAWKVETCASVEDIIYRHTFKFRIKPLYSEEELNG